MKCSPMFIKSEISFPSGSSSSLFQSVGCERGGWDQALHSQRSGTTTCRNFIYVVPSWNGVCSSVPADEWPPWNCLATCGFFHSSEITQCSAWKAALHHTSMDLWHYQDGFCLSSSQCIAWRQRYVISGRCNLALQSCFTQKQKKSPFPLLHCYETSEKSTNQPNRWKLHMHSV